MSVTITTPTLSRSFAVAPFQSTSVGPLAAAADAGDDLDHFVVMVEAANPLQVVFSREQTHSGSNLHWSQNIKLLVYWGIHYQMNDLYPHN